MSVGGGTRTTATNPTNRQWCSTPNCSREVTGGARVIEDRAFYYCPEHFPDR